jgi:hypothetical protein
VNEGTLEFADENYARELLQLFSIGLYKLNDDGTIKTDSRGNELRTYTNEDLTEYARAFVGFFPSAKRGNIEDRGLQWAIGTNVIDPMSIEIMVKDFYPKVSFGAENPNFVSSTKNGFLTLSLPLLISLEWTRHMLATGTLFAKTCQRNISSKRVPRIVF